MSYFQQVVEGVDLIVDIIVRQHLLSLHQLQSLLDCHLVNAKTKTASTIKLLKLIFNILSKVCTFYLNLIFLLNASFAVILENCLDLSASVRIVDKLVDCSIWQTDRSRALAHR